MKKSFKQLSVALALGMVGLTASSAFAGTVTYSSPKHIFNINDVQCGNTGSANDYGTACLSPSLILNEKDGLYYYGIDSDYGYDVQDFNFVLPTEPRLRDGVYEEGMVQNLLDDFGNTIGIKTVTQITARWKAGPLRGEWLAGLGGLSVKGASEKYRVMDHVLNAEWMPPLIEAQFAIPGDPSSETLNVADFSTRMKDDGKILFMWGNLNKEPTELRLFTTMPLPAAWYEEGANYTVTSAKLIVKHKITTSPNDQIRPEDFENENATGILPQYIICPEEPITAPGACAGLPAGAWVSAVDSIEGDEDFIPAGTLLRSPDLIVPEGTTGYYPSADLVKGYTNAWFTTLDRDPFGGDNPRYRLKSSKYGQDIPGVEIPQYTAGEMTTTTIDLLTIYDDAGNSILAQSANWKDYLDVNPEKFDLVDDNFTADGCKLSNDFDLMLYSKGEYSGTEIYDAQLVLTYEDPNYNEPPADQVDVSISAVNLPKVRIDGTGEIVVLVKNELMDVATGTLYIVVEDQNGVELNSYSIPFETTPTGTDKGYILTWTAPSYKTVVKATATAVADGTDVDPSDNSASSTVLVK